MFRGDSKLNISTKINIFVWLGVVGSGSHHYPSYYVVVSQKKNEKKM